MSTELKPCPFCGGDVEIESWASGNQWRAECSECGVGESYNPTRQAAIDFWNSRHVPDGYALVPIDNLVLLLGNFAKSTEVPRYKRMAEAIIAAAQEEEG